MRILLLSNEVVPERAGGIATYTSTIAPALAARGHDVHVLSCAPEHATRDDHSSGVWWHRRPILGRYGRLMRSKVPQSQIRVATAYSFRTWLRRLGYRFDVVESPEWMAPSLLIGLTQELPLIVHLHTPLNILFAYGVPRFNTDLRMADRLERATVRRATAVTSASNLLAETLIRKGWLSKQPAIIPYPVDDEQWRGVPSVLDTSPTILVVGRVESRKAPEVAVEATAHLAADVPGVRLVFLGRSSGTRGDRPYGDWVAELAERKGIDVTFIPQTPHGQVPGVYRQARVVAVPSHFESFSIAALEGMASARPVVVSSQVGAAEVLRDTGAGREVPPDNARALADALKPYLLDARQAAEAGDLGREVVRTRCAPGIIAAQRERCYDDAISTRRKAAKA